jgi:ATP-dependent DNA helicase RecQ
MIDDSPAAPEFKRGQIQKLEALLSLAEAYDCRRVRLLAYFGEASGPCGNCDNCLEPPATWDATVPAQKALSCIYRFGQTGGHFGAGHLIDVLRGRLTEKVMSNGHQALSTYGIGADVSERQWRAVLRQLIALGHLRTDGEFNTLEFTATSREVLRAEIAVMIRVARERPAKPPRNGKKAGTPIPLDPGGTTRFEALKAWRSEVARERALPAYVVFHDATLAAMAAAEPTSLADLGKISGVGAKKLETYGADILRVLEA